jgi:DNA-binding MarR family transcriptional regulator
MTFAARGPELLGTRLRHLLEVLDGDISAVYADLGLAEIRPRFVAYVRTVAAAGPSSIRHLAAAIGVTHSAASQTVAQMARHGLVTLSPGADARQRIVHLTPKAAALLPVIDAEYTATATATAELESELSAPLSVVVEEFFAALSRRSMRDRIVAADPDLLIRRRAPGDGESRPNVTYDRCAVAGPDLLGPPVTAAGEAGDAGQRVRHPSTAPGGAGSEALSGRVDGEQARQLPQDAGPGPVVDPGAAPVGVDETGLAQGLEVVGDRGAGEFELRGEIADADLAVRSGSDHGHQLEPDRVAEGLERRGEQGGRLGGDALLGDRRAARRQVGDGQRRRLF